MVGAQTTRGSSPSSANVSFSTPRTRPKTRVLTTIGTLTAPPLSSPTGPGWTPVAVATSAASR